ncbi:MAG: hypothetical protein KC443_10650 [Anaerolineales bacterium]|nr:hypothetical protein [Anaerolineales bacterium]MCB8968907.1 hypothetical protein [Ardenticatenaceae bacterium]
MFRRIIGLLMLALGLVGIVISAAGVYYGRQAVDSTFSGLDDTLVLATQGLDTAVDSLELAKLTLGDVNNGLDTVGEATLNMAKTVTDTRPLLDQVSVVVSQNAPASVEAMQSSIPALAEVAATIDQTLSTLSAFSIDEEILGVPFKYDLGINYAPEVPFDEAFEGLGSSLEGLPEELRSVDGNLSVANENLAAISDSIVAISADLDTINGRIAEVPAQIDSYVEIVDQINGSLETVRTQVTQQQERVKLILTFVLVWWGMPQLALVMIGWDFLFGRRGATAKEIREDVMEELEEEFEELRDNDDEKKE